ncbi:hypothetical protein D3C80_859720 [compost metagenome]
MSRIPIGVHEDDGDGAVTGIELSLQVGADGCLIRHRLDLAIGTDTLVDFDDGAVKQFGLDDPFGKNVGTGLITDRQCIAETARGDEQRLFALAFQKRIGGNRRAHLHRADQSGRDRLSSRDA